MAIRRVVSTPVRELLQLAVRQDHMQATYINLDLAVPSTIGVGSAQGVSPHSAHDGWIHDD